MSLLIWGAMFEVGVAEMDQHHHTLFSLANQLAESARQGQGKEPLEKIFEELLRYTQYHFSSEEKLMAAHGYPDAEQHKQAHQELIRKVAEAKRNFSAGEDSIVDEMMGLFTNWLAHHIMETDKDLSKYLIEKGVR